MPTNTYVELDAVTVATATPSVTFTSINQGYTDLVIVARPQISSTGTQFLARFNSDSGSNYSGTYLYGGGGGPGTSRDTNVTSIGFASSGVVSTSDTRLLTMNIMNYSNSQTFKTALIRDSYAQNIVDATVALWRSTSAITSVTIFPSGGNISVGSTFALYGIKANSGDVSPKALGGAVYSDSTYWYHAFTNSGTFAPSESLTADVLVIAGGGGGALAGGGAGGVQLFSSQSISTSQSVTVGAGGAAGHCGADGTTGIRGAQGGNSAFGALTASVGGGGGGALSNTQSVRDGGAGGSGGGGGVASSAGGGAGGANTSGQGFAGGAGYHSPGVFLSSGGAGSAGGAGANYSGATPGVPGPGVTTYSSWGLPTYTGHNVSGTVWFASGGQQTGTSTRPNGGGGIGTNYTSFNNALQATGGGGGSTYGPNNGGNGGSGVVIVRYAK